jgi:hypothetical protein
MTCPADDDSCTDMTACPACPAWRRDPQPTPICACAHTLTAHNIETKRQACSTCSCAGFAVRALAWTERRVVVEDVA